jgi:predicted ribosomally synthesized peptide with SipW-like signal peptide
MSRRHTRALAPLASMAMLSVPSTSAAFSDTETFARPTLAAGGGGRHFTGSVADGYSCNVCHDGGRPPSLELTGLPLDGYQPGAHYEVMVTWAAEVDKFATALEFTDGSGHVAGSLRLPPSGEIERPEFCEPASDGVLAASLEKVQNGRQVIHVPDCGSKRLRFLWTAPAQSGVQVWFSGSAVWSDGEADAYHDGVTEYGRVLSAAGVASVATASCTVNAPRKADGSFASMVAGLLLVLACLIVRRRKRSALPRESCR